MSFVPTKQTKFRLWHIPTQRYVTVTSTYSGEPGWRIWYHDAGTIWEVDNLADAVRARHTWVPADWSEARYNRPINGMQEEDLVVIQVDEQAHIPDVTLPIPASLLQPGDVTVG